MLYRKRLTLYDSKVLVLGKYVGSTGEQAMSTNDLSAPAQHIEVSKDQSDSVYHRIALYRVEVLFVLHVGKVIA